MRKKSIRCKKKILKFGKGNKTITKIMIIIMLVIVVIIRREGKILFIYLFSLLF